MEPERPPETTEVRSPPAAPPSTRARHPEASADGTKRTAWNLLTFVSFFFLPTSQERRERKRRAKEERTSKGEAVLEEGGERACKICKEVRDFRSSVSAAWGRRLKKA